MTQHQRKGSMRQTCCVDTLACATRPFASMAVIKSYPEGVQAVKCSAHQPAAPRAIAVLPELQCDASADLAEGEGLPCGH